MVTIQFRPYGVKLEFTPIVNDDGTIRLTVAPEVSSLDYTNSVTIGGFTVPALSTRSAETQVELRSDQSFAISGLLNQPTTDLAEQVSGHCQHSHPRSALQVEECQPLNNGASGDCHSNPG